MKCLALFRGEVTCVLRGGTRIVNVWRPFRKDADKFIANMKRNYARGLKRHDFFEARVMKEKGKAVQMKITKWTPKLLSPRTLARIKREVAEMTKGIEWSC